MIDSLQLTDNHSVATPANWKHGDDVVIVPSLQDPEVLKQKFPEGLQGAAAVPAHDAAAQPMSRATSIRLRRAAAARRRRARR